MTRDRKNVMSETPTSTKRAVNERRRMKSRRRIFFSPSPFRSKTEGRGGEGKRLLRGVKVVVEEIHERIVKIVLEAFDVLWHDENCHRIEEEDSRRLVDQSLHGLHVFGF